MEEEVLNKAGLAALLKVELKTINYLVYTKQIPRFKCGREYRFLRSEILRWIRRKTEGNMGGLLESS
jgi:excisionase family DNA binding protein